MSPLLYPLLLLLYGECSEKGSVRLTSRVLLYCYTFSVLLFTILPPEDTTILYGVLPYIIGYSVLGYLIKETFIRVILFALVCLQTFNYLCLYSEAYTTLMFVPFYFEYSNVILRETHVILITWNRGDLRLKILTFIFYFIEYTYIMGF